MHAKFKRKSGSMVKCFIAHRLFEQDLIRIAAEKCFPFLRSGEALLHNGGQIWPCPTPQGKADF